MVIGEEGPSTGSQSDISSAASSAQPVAPSVIAWARMCFAHGKDPATSEELETLIVQASDAAMNDFDEASARQWAAGYEFPRQCLDSDTACLRAAQLDFVSMIRRRLKTLSPGRLNAQRVSCLREDNPERMLMTDLADGMRVHQPKNFTPNGRSPQSPLRATYVSVASAVNKMLGDIVQQKLAFLIPYNTAKEYVPNLHLCKAHWTRKKGKPSGRPLGDLTFVDGTPLNTPETAAAATEYYGEITHPTIEDIAVMICNFWTKTLATNPDAE